MTDPIPTPALPDCDDPARQLEMVRKRFFEAMSSTTASVARLADVIWPIIEDNPPGWLAASEAEDMGNPESKDENQKEVVEVPAAGESPASVQVRTTDGAMFAVIGALASDDPERRQENPGEHMSGSSPGPGPGGEK